MIDKNLIQVLRFRDKIIEVSSWEEKYNIILPPIFKSFICTFEPNIGINKVKISNSEEFIYFLEPVFSSEDKINYSLDDDELCFERFKTLEELFKELHYLAEGLEDFVSIATNCTDSSILVGIGKNNTDQIFYWGDSLETTFLATNIYEFLHKFLWIKDEVEPQKISLEKLFKRWGEDFWRM